MILRISLQLLGAVLLFSAQVVQVHAYLTPGEAFGVEPQIGEGEEDLPPLPSIAYPVEQEPAPETTPSPDPTSLSSEPSAPSMEPSQTEEPEVEFSLQEAETPEIFPEVKDTSEAAERLHAAAAERREKRAQNVRSESLVQDVVPPPTPIPVLQAHSVARPLPVTGLASMGILAASLCVTGILFLRRKIFSL